MWVELCASSQVLPLPEVFLPLTAHAPASFSSQATPFLSLSPLLLSLSFLPQYPKSKSPLLENLQGFLFSLAKSGSDIILIFLVIYKLVGLPFLP